MKDIRFSRSYYIRLRIFVNTIDIFLIKTKTKLDGYMHKLTSPVFSFTPCIRILVTNLNENKMSVFTVDNSICLIEKNSTIYYMSINFI